MKEHPIVPAALMPKWWQRSTTALLYAAYGLWLLPPVLYFWGGVDLLTAFAWLVGVVVVQFVLVKLIALIEFMSTGSEIDRLRAEEDKRAARTDLAQLGEKK
jgi:fatty acid desaturase